MSSAVHQPGQVQRRNQSEQETHEKSVPKRFSPEYVWHVHWHKNGEKSEHCFIVPAQRYAINHTYNLIGHRREWY